MRHFDENNPYLEDEPEEDEYSGFSVTDDEGAEIPRPQKEQKKEENYDDGETVEASPIPENEQTVLIDNPDVSGLETGALLKLVITGETAAVFSDGNKVGDLKPAFVKRLLFERENWYAECVLYSVSAPVMVKLRFYSRNRKDAVKIQ